MTLCAGLCEYRTGGLCTIKLSEPLLKFRPRSDLIGEAFFFGLRKAHLADTLLHEMIHALLFVTQSDRDHDAHGPQFQAKMAELNERFVLV